MSSVNEVTVHVLFAKKRRENLLKSVRRYRIEKNLIHGYNGYNHLISNKREWNNCFIKNHQQILLDFVDFAWLEQPEGNLMDAFSPLWYNGSYTIAAKPIKTLELHYTMVQFLIKGVIG